MYLECIKVTDISTKISPTQTAERNIRHLPTYGYPVLHTKNKKKQFNKIFLKPEQP
jgi:hypothetical protein